MKACKFNLDSKVVTILKKSETIQSMMTINMININAASELIPPKWLDNKTKFLFHYLRLGAFFFLFLVVFFVFFFSFLLSLFALSRLT